MSSQDEQFRFQVSVLRGWWDKQQLYVDSGNWTVARLTLGQSESKGP